MPPHVNGHGHHTNYGWILLHHLTSYTKVTNGDKLRYFLGKLCFVIKPISEMVYDEQAADTMGLF